MLNCTKKADRARRAALRRVRRLVVGARLARACGISRCALYQWAYVPERHVETVAALTRLRPREIRPDLRR